MDGLARNIRNMVGELKRRQTEAAGQRWRQRATLRWEAREAGIVPALWRPPMAVAAFTLHVIDSGEDVAAAAAALTTISPSRSRESRRRNVIEAVET
jgi:hypothetical protein